MGNAWSSSTVRRLLDASLAAGLLLLVLPLLVVLALAVYCDSPGNPFFAQSRVGYRGRRFPMLKLRTMVPDAEQRLAALQVSSKLSGPVFKMHNDPRITRVGHWLRRYSLDELPQLANVVVGQMSLVGPRPLPPDQVDTGDDRFQRRCEVPPGMTGWWQVQGRAMHVDYDRWLNLDCEYVDLASPALDAAILAHTLPAVMRGDGAC
ncbi:MAG: sugar transferase [Armatimonadetes bacterium]|nr:sugar transferase [Armatimonadota bacterium]